MYKEICAICDRMPDYAMQLSVYMNERAGLPFEAHPFSDPAQLLSFASENHVALLLIDEAQYAENISSLEIPLVILLTENAEDTANRSGHFTSGKFRPADDLLRDVLALYEADPVMAKPGEDPAEASVPDLSGLQIFGVYSPVGRCGKTGFALAAGQILGRYRRTLYVNLEDYHGLFLSAADSGMTLSDILYMNRWQKDLLTLRLGTCIRSTGSLDYVQPPAVSLDYRDVPVREWAEVFTVFSNAGYELLLLDIGTQMLEPFLLLRLCSRIFVPSAGYDPVGQAKLRQFDQNLSFLHQEVLKDRIIMLQVPLSGKTPEPGAPDRYLQSLVKSPVGQYARHVLEELGEI